MPSGFKWLWGAHGASMFGSFITRVALPFTAAIWLHASVAGPEGVSRSRA